MIEVILAENMIEQKMQNIQKLGTRLKRVKDIAIEIKESSFAIGIKESTIDIDIKENTFAIQIAAVLLTLMDNTGPTLYRTYLSEP